MRRSLCNPPESSAIRAVVCRASLLLLAALQLPGGGCSLGSRSEDSRQYPSGPTSVRMVPLTDTWLPDPAALAREMHALGPRLAVLQVRDPQAWNAVAAALPDPPPLPDFKSGSVVGLISRIGRPVGGSAPVQLREVLDLGDAASISGAFAGGSFLPDGSTYLTLAWVETRSPVDLAEIDGQIFGVR